MSLKKVRHSSMLKAIADGYQLSLSDAPELLKIH